jgi:hypothetical protein
MLYLFSILFSSISILGYYAFTSINFISLVFDLSLLVHYNSTTLSGPNTSSQEFLFNGHFKLCRSGIFNFVGGDFSIIISSPDILKDDIYLSQPVNIIGSFNYCPSHHQIITSYDNNRFQDLFSFGLSLDDLFISSIAMSFLLILFTKSAQFPFCS